MTEELLKQMEFYATGTSSREWHIRLLVAEVRRLRAAIEHVLADAESQHPGGWGPDVTMVAVLREAVMSAHADHCGRAHYEGEGVPCRCDTE